MLLSNLQAVQVKQLIIRSAGILTLTIRFPGGVVVTVYNGEYVEIERVAQSEAYCSIAEFASAYRLTQLG